MPYNKVQQNFRARKIKSAQNAQKCPNSPYIKLSVSVVLKEIETSACFKFVSDPIFRSALIKLAKNTKLISKNDKS